MYETILQNNNEGRNSTPSWSSLGHPPQEARGNGGAKPGRPRVHPGQVPGEERYSGIRNTRLKATTKKKLREQPARPAGSKRSTSEAPKAVRSKTTPNSKTIATQGLQSSAPKQPMDNHQREKASVPN